MLRKDREISNITEIFKILDKCDVLRLGLCENNNPYVVPMNFAYEIINEQIFIYLHCTSRGKKMDIISKNNKTCFEVDCSPKIVKGNIPCKWSYEFESVIGEGFIESICDTPNKIIALNAIMKKYGFDGEPTYLINSLNGVAILKIIVTSISGKRNISL